jgi:hypothetical protein
VRVNIETPFSMVKITVNKDHFVETIPTKLHAISQTSRTPIEMNLLISLKHAVFDLVDTRGVSVWTIDDSPSSSASDRVGWRFTSVSKKFLVARSTWSPHHFQ